MRTVTRPCGSGSPAFAGQPLLLQALAGPPGQLGVTGNLSPAVKLELP